MNKFEFIKYESMIEAKKVKLEREKKKQKEYDEKNKLKCPSTVTLCFDPDKSENNLFRDKTCLIIWCCISYQHLKSQYFNDEIKDFVKYLRIKKPQTYQEFKEIVRISRMDRYGKECIDEGTFIHNPVFKLSDLFWSKLWRYINNEFIDDHLQTSLFNEEKLEIIERKHEHSKT